MNLEVNKVGTDLNDVIKTSQNLDAPKKVFDKNVIQKGNTNQNEY